MPSSERILLLWYRPFALGGVETFTLHFARAAIARGDTVWVAATHDALGPLREEFERAGATLVDWSCFGDAFMARAPQDVARQRIQRDIAAIRPTLTLLNDCNAFSVGAAPLLERLRRHMTLVDVFHIDSPDPLYFAMRRHFAASLDGIAGTNRHVLERFAREEPAGKRLPLAYIPNGVPPCEAEHSAPQPTLKLLYVGRLAQDQKRVLLLPQLLAALRDRGRAFSATICGEGPDSERLRDGLRQLGLADSVTLTGYRTPAQVQELLLTHDLLLNVSAFEGFSMSLLEALAAGCVPACTDVASIDHDRLVHGENCLLAPVDRPEALVDEWMALTPARIAQLSAAARRSAASLTSQACYERYRAFALEQRDQRPITRWPDTPGPELRWDMTRNNPWIARHPGWRGAVHALRRKVMGA
jgi:glycosyltransferase involved in cell wall biosynthesis